MKIKDLVNKINIAEDLDEAQLTRIGQKVLNGYEEDLHSSEDWFQDVKRVMELASLKGNKKNYPLPNSANIKFPLITKACYEFSSRTYPEIVRDGKVVKSRVIGKDNTGEKQKIADRIETYMNYQLLVESEDWELELDRLLNIVALIGFVCKKTYFDPVRKMIKSQICHYEDLVIHSDVKSLADARRISHVLHLHLNDLIEHSRAKVFLEDPIEELLKLQNDTDIEKPIQVIEQHCYLDLDEDSYDEPYIVTILKDSGKVVRIAPRFTEKSIEEVDGKIHYITALQLFTDYHFLVSPTGKFQSVGFGILMLHLNEAINTLLNQLTDAGQLSNLQGGYIDSRLKPIDSGESLHDPGEWKKMKVGPEANLKDGIVPISYKEPSSVLFQLLGSLIQASKELSSSTEVMTGGQQADNVKSGAVYALIEQSMKVFNSIQRRIYRSLSSEYRKIFILNSLYLDPVQYVTVLDDDIKQDDFNTETIDIIPVADPNLSSDFQRQTKLQILTGMPQLDQVEVARRILEYMNIPNPDKLMPENKGPNPEVIKVQADIEAQAQELNIKGRELALKEQQLAVDRYYKECEIVKMKADAMLSLAKAEAVDSSTQLQDLQLQLQVIQKNYEAVRDAKELARKDFEVFKQAANEKMAQEAGAMNEQTPPSNQPMVGAPPVPTLPEGPPGEAPRTE